nr:AHH domain-containing protein [uncultured Desulfobacter sp.]
MAKATAQAAYDTVKFANDYIAAPLVNPALNYLVKPVVNNVIVPKLEKVVAIQDSIDQYIYNKFSVTPEDRLIDAASNNGPNPLLFSDDVFWGAWIGAKKLPKLLRSCSMSRRLLPGNPGVVTGGSSTKLGKNMMESMGLLRSTKWSGYQAQHVIPSEVASHPVVQKIGMNLDDASNGLFLRIPDNASSTMSRHRGYHSVYNEAVESALNKMDVNQSVDALQNQVYTLQQKLIGLQKKGTPLYPSQGATVDLWERLLNK